MNITPIETRYQGIFFRSRTEARWAVFFDHLGIEWEYEKEGYELSIDGGRVWYLPDFWLPEFMSFVEIKGDRPTNAELKKARAIRDDVGRAIFVFHGIPTEFYNRKSITVRMTGGTATTVIPENPGVGFLWDCGDSSGGSCDAELCKFVWDYKRQLACIAVHDFWNLDRSLFVSSAWERNDRIGCYLRDERSVYRTFDPWSLKIREAVEAARSERFAR